MLGMYLEELTIGLLQGPWTRASILVLTGSAAVIVFLIILGLRPWLHLE